MTHISFLLAESRLSAERLVVLLLDLLGQLVKTLRLLDLGTVFVLLGLHFRGHGRTGQLEVRRSLLVPGRVGGGLGARFAQEDALTPSATPLFI